MQIKNIVIYGTGDRIRILPFRLGKVNIITGESKTGKTALIYIIDYCLGSKHCNVPPGVIRDHTEWFGLTLKFDTEELFIARQNPTKLGQATTSDVCIIQGKEIETPPPLSELEPNSKAELLRRMLEGKLRISEYEHSPEGYTRDDLTASFSHARLFCFQPQDLIAQPSNLFYRQNSQNGGFITRSIKDTLPYFLGAIREDNLRIEQVIAQKKTHLRRLQREYQAADNIKKEGISKLYELIEEAKEVGLLPSNLVLTEDNEAIGSLTEILNWTEDSLESPAGENDVLNRLVRDRTKFKEQLEEINSEIFAVTSFANEAQGYSSEAIEQEQRLLSIEIYKEPAEGKSWNSLLGIEADDITPTIEQINNSLISLREMLQSTVREQPKLRAYINKLETQKSEIENEIRILSNQINAVYREQEDARKLRNINVRKGRVIGRVSLFLESLNISQDYSRLNQQIDALEAEIADLEALISKEEKEEKLAGILNKININMTNWSSNLDIEYKGEPIRFDLKKLTLIVDAKESIPLNLMGSGANWVSYHLLIHFALHWHFVNNKRPVPNFLAIDQPTQVYYPPEKENTSDLEDFHSTDEIAVKQMFDFMFDKVQQLEGKFQVIVTDHARLRYNLFEESIVAVWRNGEKLIPASWYE